MVPFLYVVYTLLVGLKEAIASEGNPKVASMLTQVCYATVISWCTYPVVYLPRSQILKTEFMKKYLTEKFIEPLPLAILIIDLYIQGLVVCVFSWFINNTSPNPVDRATTATILGICVFWRLARELMQVMTTSLGNYIRDIF